MTTVEDVIRAIQERPEVREQVRRAILTDELLELPQLFADLTVRVDGLAVQTAANTKAIADLTVRVDGLAVQTAANTKAIADLTVRVDGLAVQTAANTKAIADLTVRVDAIAIQTAANTKAIKELTVQTAANAKAIEELTARYEESSKRVEDRLGILMGDRLERKVATIGPPRISQTLKLRRARIMHSTELLTPHGDEFRDGLELAEESGKINETDMGRLFDTDLILHARRRTGDRQTLWVAVEASTTIRVKDITRASDSADALRVAFGEDAAGVVIGHSIRDEDRARADAKGLTVILVELPDGGD